MDEQMTGVGMWMGGWMGGVGIEYWFVDWLSGFGFSFLHGIHDPFQIPPSHPLVELFLPLKAYSLRGTANQVLYLLPAKKQANDTAQRVILPLQGL